MTIIYGNVHIWPSYTVKSKKSKIFHLPHMIILDVYDHWTKPYMSIIYGIYPSAHIWGCPWPYMVDHIWAPVYGRPYMINRIWVDDHMWSTIYDHLWNHIQGSNLIIYDHPYMVDHISSSIYDNHLVVCSYMITTLECSYMVTHIWLTICHRPYMITTSWYAHIWSPIYCHPYMITTSWYAHNIWSPIYCHPYMITRTWTSIRMCTYSCSCKNVLSYWLMFCYNYHMW